MINNDADDVMKVQLNYLPQTSGTVVDDADDRWVLPCILSLPPSLLSFPFFLSLVLYYLLPSCCKLCSADCSDEDDSFDEVEDEDDDDDLEERRRIANSLPSGGSNRAASPEPADEMEEEEALAEFDFLVSEQGGDDGRTDGEWRLTDVASPLSFFIHTLVTICLVLMAVYSSLTSTRILEIILLVFPMLSELCLVGIHLYRQYIWGPCLGMLCTVGLLQGVAWPTGLKHGRACVL